MTYFWKNPERVKSFLIEISAEFQRSRRLPRSFMKPKHKLIGAEFEIQHGV